MQGSMLPDITMGDCCTGGEMKIPTAAVCAEMAAPEPVGQVNIYM